MADAGSSDRALAQSREIADLKRSLAALAQAERVQRALFAIADMAGSELDMPEMLRAIHGIVGELMYAENFFIMRYDPERDTTRFLYFADTLDWSRPGIDDEFSAAELSGSLTLATMRSGQAQAGPSRELRQRLGVGSGSGLGPEAVDWLGIPLMRGSSVRGAIVVQSYDEAHRFSEGDRQLLAYVAQHIHTALERKEAQEELERRVAQRTQDLNEANSILRFEIAERQRSERLQEALFRIAEESANADTIEDFYAAVHRIVGELLYARNFFIAQLTESGEEIDFPYSVDERDARRQRRRLAKGVTEYVLRTGRPLLAQRPLLEELARSGEVLSFGTPSVCWLGVPLMLDERAVGVIAVQSYTPEVLFTERDQELLTFVSFHIANGLTRKRAQDSLRHANAELERRVDERTRELGDSNRALRQQIVERERVEARLKHQALHDTLTGLPNRAYLLERLGVALEAYRSDRQQAFAVLFLDLDRFKVVNDSVGHWVGDEMLKEASARIDAELKAPDFVARLGGDEFAVLIEAVEDLAAVEAIAAALIQRLHEPIRVAGKELFTSASIGIALSHPRYQRAEELLRDADVAMYRAKAKGRQRFEIFDEHLHTEALRLLNLEGDLRRALNRQEFEPFFQSIVRLSDGAVLGYESLVRWRHPERGLIAPDEFLAVAEDNGSVEQIDWMMLDRTCQALPALTAEGGYVCINLSTRHFRDPALGEQLIAFLRQRQADPRRLRLEVTEGALLDNPDQIRRTLETLREAGLLAQLDDFGTGYSSLSYLHRFPIHSVKIDRSFVADLKPGRHGGSAAVVHAIRALARSMNLEVIAEGIETEAQRVALMDLGCDYGQGFLFSRPVPLERCRAA